MKNNVSSGKINFYAEIWKYVLKVQQLFEGLNFFFPIHSYKLNLGSINHKHQADSSSCWINLYESEVRIARKSDRPALSCSRAR